MNPPEYALMAEVQDAHWWYRGLRGLIAMYMKRFSKGENLRILDAGCGTGANLELMGGYGRVFGLDRSTDALGLSSSRNASDLTRGDVRHLPYSDACFDIVLLMDVLYHRGVPVKEAPLNEAYRVLKPGGLLLLNVPAYAWLMSHHDLAVHSDHRFLSTEIDTLLKSTGFHGLQTTYWNSFLFPIVVLVRMLRRGREDEGSDLAGYRPSIVTRMLEGILFCERLVLRVVRLPFGTSIFSVAKK